MTRSDIIKTLTDEYKALSLEQVDKIVKYVFDSMAKSLGRGERIELRGFGSFSLRKREPRIARNPKTGERVTTDIKYAVHFKPGKQLKQQVNYSYEED